MFLNSSQNTSDSQIPFPNVPYPVHACVATLITIPNAVVIFVYFSMRKERNKVPNYLMFAQALVDMYQATVAWYEVAVEIMLRSNMKVPMYIIDTVYAGEHC